MFVYCHTNKLWCLVRGNNKAFYVTIGEDNFIIDLIEIIKKKRKPHFDEFAPDELILWWFNIDRKQIKELDIDDVLTDENKLEDLADTVGATFVPLKESTLELLLEFLLPLVSES